MHKLFYIFYISLKIKWIIFSIIIQDFEALWIELENNSIHFWIFFIFIYNVLWVFQREMDKYLKNILSKSVN